ncbi:MAG: protease SohB [Pseudomonadales bacterium]
MEYLYQYLTFLAQTATIVVALVVVISAAAAMRLRRLGGGQDSGHLEIRKLNEHFSELKLGMQEAMLPATAVRRARKQEHKQSRKAAKQEAKALKKSDGGPVPGRQRTFVIDFHGDLQASQVRYLRNEVTAVLSAARAEDEVLVRLESAGGMVHGYGLAASQLDRVRRHGIPLVVSVDKVAASGGYLMAVVANRIIAAPFAVLGSIGVVAQVPNVHRLLKRHDIDVDVLTAGKYKRTLTVLGENTEEGRQKFIEELEDVHRLFKDYVGSHRAELDVEAVATGETWYGQHALENKLVDEICTSDEYLLGRSEESDLYEVRWVEHKRPIERLLAQIETSMDRLAVRWVEKVSQWRGGL